jgi:hypothetical protein
VSLRSLKVFKREMSASVGLVASLVLAEYEFSEFRPRPDAVVVAVRAVARLTRCE